MFETRSAEYLVIHQDQIYSVQAYHEHFCSNITCFKFKSYGNIFHMTSHLATSQGYVKKLMLVMGKWTYQIVAFAIRLFVIVYLTIR